MGPTQRVYGDRGKPRRSSLERISRGDRIKRKIKKLIGVYPNNSEIHGYLVSIIYETEIIGGNLCAGDDAEEAKFFHFSQLPSLAFQSHQVKRFKRKFYTNDEIIK